MSVIVADRDPTMVLGQQRDFTGPHAEFSALQCRDGILCVATGDDLGSGTYGLCRAGPIYAITHERPKHKSLCEGYILMVNVLIHTPVPIHTPPLATSYAALEEKQVITKKARTINKTIKTFLASLP